ncbi:23S ribosomal RNA methyltransferase Erm [Nocardia goodfellowii]|uniref:23S rRNA (Adenine-N6)-dimethyltransferase n=1 Tax=Nocardia goodfellowii TaxID=882446 RepID=A0ABS4QJ28_9NOCA|nr:23S ribosomal RNA methyltransferase Erm [Nocardia goodfellowii]MBP2191700.1 23S rRNA (adenine-N6)-dimethyltransferase [Nocardia goodfellowii]
MSRNRSLPRARSTHASRRKRLSQNFLTTADTARLLVRSSGIGPSDLVVEIGPGDGMLTRRLLDVAGRVLAYEIDGHYAARLRRRYADDKRIHCYHSDFRAVSAPHEPFAVVANIPFAGTTDIVRWCLSARHLTSATLLVQAEFARKHTGDYGRWTKLAITHWPTVALELGPRVSRHRFHPVPQVDAAVLHLRPHPEPLLPHTALPAYRRLVDLGFSGIGGSLAASLTQAFPPGTVREACANAGVPRDQPVGLVTPHQWLSLFHTLR